MLKKNLLLLSLLTVIWACSKENNELIVEAEPVVEQEVSRYSGVDPLLWEYFERFEEKGRERGIEMDLRAKKITGIIQSIGEDDVAGQCNYNSLRPNHVIIDQAFWDRATVQAREFVVFHELGHCDLLRDHREGAFGNGTCLSIMRSGLGTCRDNYNERTREAYLDELFDPNFANQIP